MADVDPELFRCIVELEQLLLQPHVRASGERLDALIADDFEEIGASGARFGKADVLQRLPVESGISFAAHGFSARELAPGLVLLNYRAARRDVSGKADSLRSSIWRRDPDGWRMTFHQGTRLP